MKDIENCQMKGHCQTDHKSCPHQTSSAQATVHFSTLKTANAIWPSFWHSITQYFSYCCYALDGNLLGNRRLDFSTIPMTIHAHAYFLINAGFLFIGKWKGLKHCIEYRGLNSITVKYAYPFPLVQKHGAEIFTKLNLQSACNLIRITWETIFIISFPFTLGFCE